MPKFFILTALLINGNFSYARSGSGGGTMPGRVFVNTIQFYDQDSYNLLDSKTSRLNTLFDQSYTSKALPDISLLSLSIASFIAFESDEKKIKLYKDVLVDHVAVQMLVEDPSLYEDDALAAARTYYDFLLHKRQTSFY
jgi:hypothetical protein